MTDILCYKPGHDGHVAYVSEERLVFSIEAEKDNFPRYAELSPATFIKTSSITPIIPDVVALSGWVKGFHSIGEPVGAGYFGAGPELVRASRGKFFGKNVAFFSSTHERSHIYCAYGLSPFPAGQPVYALIWEGNIGSFYFVDENAKAFKIGDVLEDPGNKYAYGYGLADPTFAGLGGDFRFEDAGKMMALSAYGAQREATPAERALIDDILARRSIILSTPKKTFEGSHIHNAGLGSQAFRDFSKQLTNEIFERFFRFAETHLRDGHPLVIAGGCGLNCEWNSRWKRSGLFSDVFVPPCTNDSGSAIGTAVDAMRHFTGRAKLTWDVYAGEEFVMDDADLSAFSVRPLQVNEIAEALRDGSVLAWVQGKYEIGPRALGNRSLLAAPFESSMHSRLNAIKQREGFRPIAPICLEEDIDLWFEADGPSPHMLYFQHVKSNRLPAVTHVDRTARLQSVNRGQNPQMHDLLCAFKDKTGVGVLCNTSLNFKGAGFINRLSDLARYVVEHDVDGFVVGKTYYRLNKAA